MSCPNCGAPGGGPSGCGSCGLGKNPNVGRAFNAGQDQLRQNANQTKDGGGCFIATATLGDSEHPYVLELQEFRDEVLLHSALGRIFVKGYYKLSPSLSRLIENSIVLKYFARKLIVSPALNYVRKYKRIH